MDKIWQWITRVSGLSTIISLFKGWDMMNMFSEFWKQLTPWQFLFFLSVGILFILFVRDYWRLRNWIRGHSESAFTTWLKGTPDSQYMASESLEGKIMTMLDWWDKTRNTNK